MESNRIDYTKIFEAQLAMPPGPFMDCYAFSIHKSGSSLMHGMIAHVCTLAKLSSINIPDTLFAEGIFEKDWGNDPGILSLISPGRVFYGFRALPSVLLDQSVNLEDKKCVLLVRDPRDALVSQYYSFGGAKFSHRLPGKNQDVLLNYARKTEDLAIDEYVLKMADPHLAKLAAYCDKLPSKNVLLRRYEDIYFDKLTFLRDIFDHFGIDVPEALLDTVSAQHDIRPEAEDPSKHIRKGTPGDHAEKLRPETIQELNRVFKDVAARYGYDLV